MALFDLKTWMAIAIAALVALVGLQQIRVSNAKAATSAARAELASDRATYAQAAQIAEQSARAEESRRTAATQKVIHDAKLETSAAQIAAGDAVRAADGLRKRVAALVAAGRQATSNPGTTGRSTGDEGGDALDLLAGVLARTDDAAGGIAAYADQLRVAGQACERYADGLQPR